MRHRGCSTEPDKAFILVEFLSQWGQQPAKQIPSEMCSVSVLCVQRTKEEKRERGTGVLKEWTLKA